MSDSTDEQPSAIRRVRERLTVVVGQGGLVLVAIVVMVVVLVLVLLLVSWFTGLGPEGPGREHY
jgi:flagellar basal body-associated protein FliL